MPGPRAAVVGAGAWGTTLAAIIAKREPVVLLCHSAEVAEEINTTAAGTSAASPGSTCQRPSTPRSTRPSSPRQTS